MYYKQTLETTAYFKSAHDYFWHWADGGEVIEWRDGTTLIYRSSLMEVLAELKDCFPPLGALLLLLTAKKDPHRTQRILTDIFRELNINYQQDHPWILEAFHLLQILGSLPDRSWLGGKKTHLLQTLCSAVAPSVSSEIAGNILDNFNSGRLDSNILAPVPLSKFIVEVDLQYLAAIYKAIGSRDELLMKLQTGVSELPKPLPVVIPEPPQTDLLSELESDPATTGFTRLTRQMIAALHIPMHAHGSSDQLFGGVSDISNRGNFDRLLLSELAHDELSLMVRLANNEALYLRREQLPSDYQPERFLLVDTSIKMWGTPRLLAMAAALACSLQNKKGEMPAYALTGYDYTPLQLGTKAGVSSALELLSPELNSAAGLTAFAKNVLQKQQQEFFLITDEQLFHTASFQEAFALIRKCNGYLILVNRAGKVQLFHYTKGHRHLLNHAVYDLDSILTTTNILPAAHGLPAFLHQQEAPLYFPFSSMQLHYYYYNAGVFGGVAITEDHRLLYWKSVANGAKEISNDLPKSNAYAFGHSEQGTIYVLLNHKEALHLYYLNTSIGTCSHHVINLVLKGMVKVIYDDKNFYITDERESYRLPVDTLQIQPGQRYTGTKDPMARAEHLRILKKIINCGYNMYKQVKSIKVSPSGRLAINHMELRHHTNKLSFESWTTVNNIVPNLNGQESTIPGTQIRITRYVLTNSVEAWMDSRGLLHLRSQDPNVREITLVMIQNKPTACWAADGACCGYQYFTGEKNAGLIPAHTFYESYIQPYIDHLKLT
ncbi:hypothetical protein [Chitinophaga sancti]|uniref:hypothetical protein n=1 Tax=Chitinophaga sancti TaxID=1004 RepID=UPI003F7AC5F0